MRFFPIPRRGIFDLHLSEFAIYRILAIYVPSGFGFYDPKKKKKTDSNLPAILYILEKGAQPTGTPLFDPTNKA